MTLIKKITLFEFSIVTKAMNPQATITDFKSIDTLRDFENTLRTRFSQKEAKTLISKVKELKEFKGEPIGRDDQEDLNNKQRDVALEKLLQTVEKFNKSFNN